VLESVLLYLGIGSIAGLLAGLFGVGGGLLIVPVLAFTFRLQSVDPAVIMHMALGTSLATIVVTATSSVRAHHVRGGVLWNAVAQMVPGIVAGALLGALLANRIPGQALQRAFGAFELLVAMQMLAGWRPAPHRQLPGWTGMLTAGGAIGTVSALAGIGGGSLTVPFLTWCNVPMRKAVGSSAACGLPIALSGALGYIVVGWGHPGLPPDALGYVFWPGFAGVGAATLLLAPVGARLAHRWPDRITRRLFALLLLGLGVHMLLSY